MKKIFCLIAIIALTVACEKPNQNPVIRSITFNGRVAGTEVRLGGNLPLEAFANDDTELKRYQLNILKGAVNENDVITAENDYSFGNANNVSGKTEDLKLDLAIPNVIAPGPYRLELTFTDDDGQESVTVNRTFCVIDPNSPIEIQVDDSQPGTPTANDNIIFTRGGKSININGRIASTTDIESVKFFMATNSFNILERTFNFTNADDFLINFNDILDEQGTKYQPLIPSNISIGQSIEFIILVKDSDGLVATKSFAIQITNV